MRALEQSPSLKTCTVCKQQKPATLEFFKRKRVRHLDSWCCDCSNRQQTQRYHSDPEVRATQQKRYQEQRQRPEFIQAMAAYKKRPDVRARSNEMQNARRGTPEEKAKQRARDAERRNTDEYRAKMRAMRRDNPAYRARRNAQATALHKRPKARAWIRAYENNRKRNDPAFALRVIVSAALYARLGGVKNGKKWADLFAFTPAQLKTHMESLWQSGMTWENRGRQFGASGWEVDHVVPIAWWDIAATDDPNFGQCWSLANLQPLWGHDNRRKSASYAIIKGITYTRSEWIAANRPMPPNVHYYPAMRKIA